MQSNSAPSRQKKTMLLGFLKSHQKMLKWIFSSFVSLILGKILQELLAQTINDFFTGNFGKSILIYTSSLQEKKLCKSPGSSLLTF